MRVRAPLHSIDVRGRFALGLIFSIWRGMTYAKAMAIPTNPQSARQLQVRGLLTSLSQNWASLTNAQRESWIEYAAANPNTNVFGQQFASSGINQYVGLGVIAADMGEPALTAPPVTDEPAILAGAAAVPGALSGEIAVSWTGADGDYVDVWITQALSAGRVGGKSDFRHLSYTAIGGSPITINSLTPGAYYELKIRANRDSGQVGPFQKFRTTAKV